MSESSLQLQTRQAADLLRNSKRAVALTGAGFSTPSGIPDFRSAHSGVWNQVDPMEVASLASFRFDPEKFYGWFHSLAEMIWIAQPNAAHIALASLEEDGIVHGVVTQNVDGLHQRAGSKNVYELHGHLREAVCVECFQRYDGGPLFEIFVETGKAPYCESCGGPLKPEIVLFGEQLPYEALAAANALFDAADMVIVGGSSLEVTPAAELPYRAVEHGARLVILNREPTYLDSRADIVLTGDVAVLFPMVVDEVRLEQ
ncbi:MAG: NAD-dependent deacylase [Nitrospirae bacterium]|nr:NAD-dependent deacylase [Nitrospirota bacterium]